MCQSYTGLEETLLDSKAAGVFVEDQSKALTFYTDILGFRKANDLDLGEFRCLTVSTNGSGVTELRLEPNEPPAAKIYQFAIYADGIPATLFHGEDIHEECKPLTAKGISFKDKPLENGGALIAIFDDDCGN